MGVINKFKDLIGLEDYEEEYEDYEEEYDKSSGYYDSKTAEPPAAPKTSAAKYTAANVVSMQEKRVRAITNAFKLVVIEPQGFEDCSGLVDSLKARKPIIVNLEKLEPETARKIFDFLGGATYALSGNVQKVANNIFVFAPENVVIAADGEHKPYNFRDSGGDYGTWK
ncbi:MAG: cell division protein SepF [Firmicutes bacterium]|nr:cell division protein SepF [Bacillota bacterium]